MENFKNSPSKKLDLDKDYLKKAYKEFLDKYGTQDDNGFTGLLGTYLKPNPDLDAIKDRLRAELKEF